MTLYKLSDRANVQFLDKNNGPPNRTQFNAEAPQVCAQDYLQSIAEGDISGHSPWEILGYSISGSTTEMDLWGGGASGTGYTFPTGSDRMEAVSTHANDTAAGSGAKTVRIWYLKSDYSEATTDVVLNGTGAVATSVTDIYRVNYFRVVDFGATNTLYKACGDISLRHVADTPVYAKILGNQTRARSTIFTVPLGKTLYITSLNIGTTKGSTTGNTSMFTLRSTHDSELGVLIPGFYFSPHAEINHQDGSFLRTFCMPVKFTAGTDMKISVICGQASTTVTCALRGWLE